MIDSEPTTTAPDFSRSMEISEKVSDAEDDEMDAGPRCAAGGGDGKVGVGGRGGFGVAEVMNGNTMMPTGDFRFGMRERLRRCAGLEGE